jgi:hypothetical protein
MTEEEAVNRDKVLNAIGKGYIKMSKGTAKGYMVLIEDEEDDKSKLSVLVFNMAEDEFLSSTVMMMEDMIKNVMESEND